MKEYEIKLSDIWRILIGEVPLHFYLEVILRIALIYLILMVSMRLMGKRMSTQLSRNEMAAVASLAAAVGIPLMNPDKGLLPAVIIAALIIGYQIAIAQKASSNKKFESLTQDKYDTIIKDGVLQVDTMTHTRVSRDRVFAELRSGNFSHLGLIKRLYFEAGGTFSVLPEAKPKSGLSILPEWDTEFSNDVHMVTANVQVCRNCGHQKSVIQGGNACPNCKRQDWVKAVNLKE